MSSFSQTSKFEKKAFRKQNRRQRKGEIRNKAARKKRQPPTNKPEHSIKKSHKPKSPPSVKNTQSYQGLTRQIEKIQYERSLNEYYAYCDYYEYMVKVTTSHYEEMCQHQQAREEEERKQKAKNQLEREVQKEKAKANLETITKNNLEKIIIAIGENFCKNTLEINLKNYKVSIKPI